MECKDTYFYHFQQHPEEMNELITSIEREVKQKFENEGTGHDWWHIDRVRNNALKLAKKEGADLQLTELGALLHDIADHKFHDHDLTVGPKVAKNYVLKHGGSEGLADAVAQIVDEISFKGAGVDTPVSSKEAACVQDADRLDAIGAIGVARAFAYGGANNRLLYHPEVKPNPHDSFDAYVADKGHTINHFYEKLLLLKDRMQTKAGIAAAERRHAFMESFLEQFYEEWG